MRNEKKSSVSEKSETAWNVSVCVCVSVLVVWRRRLEGTQPQKQNFKQWKCVCRPNTWVNQWLLCFTTHTTSHSALASQEIQIILLLQIKFSRKGCHISYLLYSSFLHIIRNNCVQYKYSTEGVPAAPAKHVNNMCEHPSSCRFDIKTRVTHSSLISLWIEVRASYNQSTQEWNIVFQTNSYWKLSKSNMFAIFQTKYQKKET